MPSHPCDPMTIPSSGEGTPRDARRRARECQSRFDLVQSDDGKLLLKSAERTIRIVVNPLSFILSSSRGIQLENCLDRHSSSLQLAASALSSKSCTEIDKCIQSSSNSYFMGPDVANYPKFPRRLSARQGMTTYLAGYALYCPNGNSYSARPAEFSFTQLYVELEVPTEFPRVSCLPSCLLLYSDSAATVVERLVVVGTPANRASVFIGISRSGDAFLPKCALSVGSHVFVFRCKQEAELWKVAIEDIMSAPPKRWPELVTPSSSDEAPKGYRCHLSKLRSQNLLPSSSSSTKSAASVLATEPSGDDHQQLLRDCLTCIDYMQARLRGGCKSVTSVDLKSEDLLYDTRSRLICKLTTLTTATTTTLQ